MRHSIHLFRLAALGFLTLPTVAQGAAPPSALWGDIAIGTAVGTQQSAVFSPGASSTLAVWSDGRSDAGALGSFQGEQTGRDIYAVRLDSAGGPIETTPFPIAVQLGEQTSPRAAWNGDHWLVTWISQTATEFFYDYRVFGIRVAADGSSMDPEPFEILATGGNGTVGYDLESNGTDWLVIAQGDSGGGIQAARVASSGAVIDPVPVTIVPGSFFLYFDIQLESAGGEYLLTWDGTQSSLDDWQAQRFDSGLNPLGSQFTVPLGVTVNGAPTAYLMVERGPSQVTARRMLPDGTVLDPTPIQVTAPGVSPVFGLQVVFDGTLWWVGYDVGGVSTPSLLASRVTLDGVALDPAGTAIAPSSATIGFGIGAAHDGGLFTVWEDSPTLLAAHTAADLATDPAFSLAVSAPSQEFVDVAPWSGGYVLAWTSYTGFENEVLVQITDERGRAMSSPFSVASGQVGVARIAWNGSLFLVTWSEGGAVFGRRMSSDGSFVDPSPLDLMTGFSPDVGALGDDFLVVATNVFPGLGIHFVHPYALRVDGETGAPLDAAPQLLGQYYARYPRVETLGDRWLVTWQRNFSHDDPASEIRAVFIDADGTVDPDFNVGFGGTPRAATSGSNVLFAWRSGTSSSSDHEILARVMGLDGTFPSPAFTAATAPDKQLRPTVSWTGHDYFIAWEDMRESAVFFDERTDIYGARFTEAGDPLDANGIALLAGAMPVKRPSVASANGTTLLVASELDLAPGFTSYRLRSTAVNALVASPAALSLGSGGTQTWMLRAGLPYAGDFYWVFGTLDPGSIISLAGVDLALALDAYWLVTVLQANSPNFPGSFGTLNASGEASAAFVVPPGSQPGLAGVDLYHSFATYDAATAALEWGSNRTLVALLP